MHNRNMGTHKDITDAELNLEGYNLVRNDREDI